MPAMAGDWPRDPRAYGSPHHPEPPAAVRTLPSVAELLSSRPSATSTIPAYHHPDYLHARSPPPAASLAPTAATPAASSYWSPVNLVSHRQTSPPVSPTEQRPLSTSTVTRVYQEPTLRRQHPSKPDPPLQHSALSSEVRNASHSTVQARQDSAIDHHRFDTANDAQLSKSNLSYSHQSPKDGHHQSSPRLTSHQQAPSTTAYATTPGPPQSERPPSQPALHPSARQHSKSVSSSALYTAVSSTLPEHSAERTIPVDIVKNGADSRPNIAGPSSLPEQFFTQQNNFGTRQQRYNVRFAANYTSENMPPTQRPRNEPPTSPPTALAVVAEPEQPTSSPPAPTATSTTEESSALITNGTTHHTESQVRLTRDSRDRGDREPSVERCAGCNEAWRRPIPDMDSDHPAPAETNADYMRLASNMIERLRDQRRKADAAYDDWKWRHSHCHRPTSPYSTGSADDALKRPDAVLQNEGSSNGNTANKRKSEIPHEPHSASKQRRVTSTSPAPPVRMPEST